jgi:cyanosortase A-associated protein
MTHSPDHSPDQAVSPPSKLSLWETVRVGILIMMVGGVGVCLGRSLMINQFNKFERRVIKPPPLNFPATSTLPEWKFVQGEAIPEQTIKQTKRVVSSSQTVARAALVATEYTVLSGYQYEYQQGDRPLQIEMRYLAPKEPISVLDLLNAHPSQTFFQQQPKVNVREQADTGFYGVFTIQQQAYLSSCINPTGKSTFNPSPPSEPNYEVVSKRVWGWLMSQALIFDHRCLWVHISTPITSTPEEAYQQLEKVWRSWYPGWQGRFPNL